MTALGIDWVRSRAARASSVVLVAAGLTLALASTASAEFGFSSFNSTFQDASGALATQAGSHGNMVTAFELNTTTTNGGTLVVPDETLKDVQVDLPAGFYGNPEAIPHCSVGELLAHDGICSPSAQVGVLSVEVAEGFTADFALYNFDATTEQTAVLGADVFGAVVKINVSVRTDGDYGLQATSSNINQGPSVFGTKITLWGVPADPINDPQRFTGFNVGGASAGIPRRPFITLPARCDAPLVTKLRADSWQHPGRWVEQTASTQLSGCDRLQFTPSVTARPEVSSPSTPSAYDVDVSVPQDDSILGLATPQLKKAVVTFPEGVAVSPGSASGLGACSDAQLALGTDREPSCPNSSKIGTVSITTPVFNDPLTGELVLGTPHPDQLFRLFIVVRGHGLVFKLPGVATPDEQTGQLVTTFDNTPQLPFSVLRVHLKGGSRAPLSNPATCGTKTVTSRFDTWTGTSASPSDVFAIAGGDCERTFAPLFEAGTTDTSAGRDTSFTLMFSRSDRDRVFGAVATDLPAGLLGRVSSVAVLCGERDAAAGTCPGASRLGTTTTSAGSGASPFSLQGGVYLTGPYKGGPYGLSIAVPALAGPFDLGMVVVRASIQVDPSTAALRVVSDPLPRILRGIPLNVRTVSVLVARPGFMINPTSCAAKAVGALIGSDAGVSAAVQSRFQVTDCASLGYRPKLAIALTGKGQTTDGKHPGLSAHLAPRSGDANARKATVSLPLSLALDPDNANGLCEPADAAVNRCSAKTVVGHATARSLLPDPLTGPVYFVRGERRDPKSGRVIRTLPKLFIPLSANGVTVYVNASSAVKDDHLVTVFDNLPDAPFSSFDLQIDGGKHGILTVSDADVCAGKQIAQADFDAQNGKASSSDVTLSTPCGLRVTAKSHTSSAVKLTIGGVGAGRVSVSGSGLVKTSRAVRSATTMTLKPKLTKAARLGLARGRDVKVRALIAFRPRGVEKTEVVRKTLTIRAAKR